MLCSRCGTLLFVLLFEFVEKSVEGHSAVNVVFTEFTEIIFVLADTGERLVIPFPVVNSTLFEGVEKIGSILVLIGQRLITVIGQGLAIPFPVVNSTLFEGFHGSQVEVVRDCRLVLHDGTPWIVCADSSSIIL